MNRLLGFASLGVAVMALGVALTNSREVEAPAPVVEAPPSASPQQLQALERRLKSLEDTAVHLSSRVMALERRPMVTDGGAVVAAMPSAELAHEVEQLRTEVRGMIAGEALNSQGGREYLKEMVRSVQDEMRTAQREERQQQWVQAQAQALTNRSERLRQFVSEAGLNYNQEQELMRRMQGEDAQRQALLQEVEAGSKSPQDVRRALRTLRSETDKEMQQILSEEQRAKYQELRREERGQGGQGGRGGGDGPRGNRGGG
ncbi:hypothetical protein [Hyalangium rubrum]|uniref:Uncharacterized protein n=1 Tax=Hyalangium rubrum TaxID=3103134 RepID=A0ABU5H3V6_9BACT|nr:hypothetical protein [Hyalangium sp. s54d21]MDY7227472.1 hypothetical protein [Hyalangium sp. s54d21]